MRHSEGKFRGAGKLELYYQSWHPKAPARAAIAIVPGLGEHSGRCRNIGNHLVPRGYAIYAFDLRGNGRSPGQRGYVKEWKEFREDVASFLALIRDREPHTPIFLFGESLGGVIALDYCLSRPPGLSGLICAAPALGEVGVPRFLWMLARVLNRVLPRFSLPTGLDDSNLSRDPEVVKAFQQDSLTHSRGTARLAMEFRRAVEWIHAHADGLELPLLIVHGTADRIASAEGSREFIRKVKFPDKDLREYEGGYHELYNDIIKDKVLADTEQWLERRLCHLHGAEIAISVSYAQTHD
jgi:alpha-beta hydrolase superfamily lysophospholipase